LAPRRSGPSASGARVDGGRDSRIPRRAHRDLRRRLRLAPDPGHQRLEHRRRRLHIPRKAVGLPLHPLPPHRRLSRRGRRRDRTRHGLAGRPGRSPQPHAVPAHRPTSVPARTSSSATASRTPVIRKRRGATAASAAATTSASAARRTPTASVAPATISARRAPAATAVGEARGGMSVTWAPARGCHGGPGNDRLFGGPGADQLYGGPGIGKSHECEAGWGTDAFAPETGRLFQVRAGLPREWWQGLGRALDVRSKLGGHERRRPPQHP
jgi:RTX calcium-binding nonapeptide repeat (4 copies)